MLKTENPRGHGLIGVRPFEGDGSSMGPRKAELEEPQGLQPYLERYPAATRERRRTDAFCPCMSGIRVLQPSVKSVTETRTSPDYNELS